MTQYSVTGLANGATISCELCLDPDHLPASETYVQLDKLH